jgi:hypothetical protein
VAEADKVEAKSDESKDDSKKDDKPEAKDQVKKPDDERLELAHAKAKDQVKKLTNDNVTLSKRAETAEAEIKSIRESVQANPFKALEQLTGLSLQEIIERGKKGEFDDKAPKLSPEDLEMREFFRQQKAEKEARAKEEERKSTLAELSPKVTEYLTTVEDQFPLFTAFDTSAEDVLAIWYDARETGENRTIPEIIANLEGYAADQFPKIMGNRKLLQRLATTNPSIRDILLETADSLRGLTKQQTTAHQAADKGTSQVPPRTVATQTEVTSRTQHEASEEEELAESLRLLRQYRTTGHF